MIFRGFVPFIIFKILYKYNALILDELFVCMIITIWTFQKSPSPMNPLVIEDSWKTHPFPIFTYIQGTVVPSSSVKGVSEYVPYQVSGI